MLSTVVTMLGWCVVKKSRLLSAASVIALTALVVFRVVPASQAQEAQAQFDQFTELFCEVGLLTPEETGLLQEAGASVEAAVQAALSIVSADATKLPSVVASLVDAFPQDRELVLATLTASNPERAPSIAATVIGCECRDDEEYASLVNVVIASAPGAYEIILDFALNNCPEIALALIEPATGTILPPVPTGPEDGYG